MNTKMLLAGLAAGVTGFLLGWVLFGMLLMGYYEANMIEYEGLMKPEDDMRLGVLFLGNLLFGLLVAWACWRMGREDALGGLRTGAVIGLLVYGSMALFFLSMWNLYANNTIVVVDILANTVWTAGMGLVAGFVLGTGKKTAG